MSPALISQFVALFLGGLISGYVLGHVIGRAKGRAQAAVDRVRGDAPDPFRVLAVRPGRPSGSQQIHWFQTTEGLVFVTADSGRSLHWWFDRGLSAEPIVDKRKTTALYAAYCRAHAGPCPFDAEEEQS